MWRRVVPRPNVPGERTVFCDDCDIGGHVEERHRRRDAVTPGGYERAQSCGVRPLAVLRLCLVPVAFGPHWRCRVGEHGGRRMVLTNRLIANRFEQTREARMGTVGPETEIA